MEAAFFDLDKTIVARSSSFTLARPMYRAGMVSRRTVVQSAYAQLLFVLLGANDKRIDRAKDAILALSKNWDSSEVEELVRDVIADLIEPYVYLEALDLIAIHRAAGRKIYVVSSSPEEVVRPLAEHFGADGVIATRAEIVDGRYTGKLAFYCHGEEKATAMRELAEREDIDLSASFAYSDAVSDLPMLEAVGTAVAVNPERELRRAAIERSWEVRDFSGTVRVAASGEGEAPSGSKKPWAAVLVAGTAGLVVTALLVRSLVGSKRRKVAA